MRRPKRGGTGALVGRALSNAAELVPNLLGPVATGLRRVVNTGGGASVSEEQIDALMTEVGMRAANAFLQTPLDGQKVDDLFVDALGGADLDQKFEIADLLIDLMALCQIFQWATDNGELAPAEVADMRGFLSEIDTAAKSIMLDLIG